MMMLAAAASGPQPAPIGYMTAGQLADKCNQSEAGSVDYCFAYIAAANDTARAYEIWLGQREFCAPQAIPQSDLRKAFLAYVAAYPDTRNGQAASVIVVALKETFPCGEAPAAGATVPTGKDGVPPAKGRP